MEQSRTSYLDLVRACDNFSLDHDIEKSYYKLYLPHDNRPHGYMLPEIVDRMPWTSDFHVSHTHPRSVTVLDSSDGKDTSIAVNNAFAEVISTCIDRDLFHVLDRKHSEPFAIRGANYPVHLERFATSLFGTTSCGAHLVAYTTTSEGMKLWIPRRAAHLYTFPNMLDTTVAGGVKAGVSSLKTMVEEADEEASLDEVLVRAKIRSRGVITYVGVTGKGFPGEQGLVLPDMIFVYDMELPAGVVPKPRDDEVMEFYCMSVGEVQAALLHNEFKVDSAAVLVDFLMRHNIITPENENSYVEISMHLHRRLPFRVKPACN